MASRNPISILNENAQQYNRGLPIYECIDWATTSNSTIFRFKVFYNGKSSIGEGKSKKEAKNNAATNLCCELGLIFETVKNNYSLKDEATEEESKVGTNYVGSLLDFCRELDYLPPVYNACNPPGSNEFIVSCKVGGVCALGKATTIKASKQLAARDLLRKLESEKERACLASKEKIRKLNIFSSDASKHVIDKLNSCKILKTAAFRESSDYDSKKTKISNISSIFQSGHYPYSKLLERLVIREGDYDDIENSPEKLLELGRSLSEELNLIYSYESVPSKREEIHLFCLQLKCRKDSAGNHSFCPVWTFPGVGNCESNAKAQASFNWIQFAKMMAVS